MTKMLYRAGGEDAQEIHGVKVVTMVIEDDDPADYHALGWRSSPAEAAEAGKPKTAPKPQAPAVDEPPNRKRGRPRKNPE